MLVNRISPATRPGQPVLVLLHGRGADESDLVSVAEALLPEGHRVLVRAPFPGLPWGYGPGWAWYQFLGGATPDPVHFEESQQALAELLDALPHQLAQPAGSVVLGGFSQGGTMSLGFALRHPGRVAGVLNLSGFVPDHPSASPARAAGLDLFWGHGTADPAVPFTLATAGREALGRAGARITPFDHANGHTITPDELTAARAWIGRVTAAAGGHA